jgi:general secretion pathway protein A
MYDKHFGFKEPPFSVTPNPRFFYKSPIYEEAFSVLRYGIEGRKGFIVITGEAGTGKTTLLRMLMHTMASSVHTAFIFNPQLNFTELLRLILNDLGVPNSTDDRLTLIGLLNDYLIEQLKKGNTVALLVDEAQHLGGEMLEELRLLSNLETDKEKLIQIVLMGQPELGWKLDQPELRQLKQRVSLRCHLFPLSRRDVSHYIAYRVKTAGYESKELFVPEAIERIASYSSGIPRFINIICDNALLIAYSASKHQVSATMIEEVARDLQLTEPPKKDRARSFTLPEKRQEAFSSVKADDDSALKRLPEPVFGAFEEPLELRQTSVSRPHGSAWAAIRTVLGIFILMGAGVLLYSSQGRDYLSDLTASVETFVGVRLEHFEQANLGPAGRQEETSEEPNTLQALAFQDLSLPAGDLDSEGAPVPETSNLGQSWATQGDGHLTEEISPKSAPALTKKIRTAVKKPIDIPVSDNLAPTGRKLEFEIYKAIHNRAIRGVEVAIIDDTVSLTGWVATERQKSVAAQAARGVPGVKQVRNQIIVDSETVSR